MCLGTGSPTVVLDAGLGADSSVWNSVLLKVREFTRVCAYDRAGLGESDPAPKKPRTSQDMVKDLHTLLANTNSFCSICARRVVARRLQCTSVCQSVSTGSCRHGSG